MRIAIATSEPQLPPSDVALSAALIKNGAAVSPVVWHSSDIEWRGFDCVVVRSCWDYHLRLNEFLEWIERVEQSGVTMLNSPNLIRWNANKRYLRELASAGVAIPDTVWVRSGEQVDIEKLCETRGWPAAVVKPLVSESAYGTERLARGVVRGPNMIQEYLSSIETEGEWSLLYFGGRFSHAARKRPRRDDFRVQMEFGGTVEPGTPDAAMLEFAEDALSHLPEAAAIARVDILTEERGSVLMEMEVIEPELFIACDPGADERAAHAVIESIRSDLRPALTTGRAAPSRPASRGRPS